MDSIDLDSQPVLGMWSDTYWILNRFRMDLGESMNSHKFADYFLPNRLGSGELHDQGN